MVVFVDLESDDDDSSLLDHYARRHSQVKASDRDKLHGNEQETREASFAAVLTCYPVALSLASHLDLNDLYALSLTCRSIHSSLSQYSSRLVSNSLRCTFDSQPLLSDLLAAQFALGSVDPNPHTSSESTEASHSTNPPLLSLSSSRDAAWNGSKIRTCARDLVAECRKCGTIVCRNCASKGPSDKYLKERHRRLCQKCLEAPLSAHLQLPSRGQEWHLSYNAPSSSAGSTRSARSESGSSTEALVDSPEISYCTPNAFTASAFLREPCSCPTRGVYLCLSCGNNVRANDTTYRRVWTWRSRYSTHIGGGLGTGLGVGNQGQKCGRSDQCLENGANSVSWVEIDCSESHGAEDSDEHDFTNVSRAGTPVLESSGTGSVGNRPGYLQQEIEGIGGMVKKKVRKKVKVGATVGEFEDERMDPRKYLEREATGKERSWCGWCARVCLGENDRHSAP